MEVFLLAEGLTNALGQQKYRTYHLMQAIPQEGLPNKGMSSQCV